MWASILQPFRECGGRSGTPGKNPLPITCLLLFFFRESRPLPLSRCCYSWKIMLFLCFLFLVVDFL
nr:MAG TPA: hypothetical protein [Caudoviricetes sp.]